MSLTPAGQECWSCVLMSMNKSVKTTYKPSGPSGRSFKPGFRSIKQLGVFQLSPEWIISLSQGYHPALSLTVPFIYLGRGRHCKRKVFCTRTEHRVTSQSSNPDCAICNSMRPPQLLLKSIWSLIIPNQCKPVSSEEIHRYFLITTYLPYDVWLRRSSIWFKWHS